MFARRSALKAPRWEDLAFFGRVPTRSALGIGSGPPHRLRGQGRRRKKRIAGCVCVCVSRVPSLGPHLSSFRSKLRAGRGRSPESTSRTETIQALPPPDAAKAGGVDVERWCEEVLEDWRKLEQAPEDCKSDPDLVVEATRLSAGEALRFALGFSVCGVRYVAQSAFRSEGRVFGSQADSCPSGANSVDVSSAEIWAKAVDLGPNLGKFGRAPADIGPVRPRVYQKCEPMSADRGPTSTMFGHMWFGSAQVWPNLGRTRPNVGAETGQIEP